MAAKFALVGMGIKISTIPIMTSECVPAIIRGGLVMSFQLWVAFGIFMYEFLITNELTRMHAYKWVVDSVRTSSFTVLVAWHGDFSSLQRLLPQFQS